MGSTSSSELHPVIPANHAEGCNGDTLLIDIPWDKMGTLLGLTDTYEWIPTRFVSRCAKAFTHVIGRLLAEKTLLWWKKLFLLPRVLFSRIDKATLSVFIKQVFDDKWDFRLSDFPMKKITPNAPNNSLGVVPKTYAVKNFVEGFLPAHKKVHSFILTRNT